jgi:hypothetical protein
MVHWNEDQSLFVVGQKYITSDDVQEEEDPYVVRLGVSGYVWEVLCLISRRILQSMGNHQNRP